LAPGISSEDSRDGGVGWWFLFLLPTQKKRKEKKGIDLTGFPHVRE
jgi:hypothetical protein